MNFVKNLTAARMGRASFYAGYTDRGHYKRHNSFLKKDVVKGSVSGS